MRLLHSTTLKLHEFIGSKIPPYAILSHTWGDEEVSFQKFQSNNAVEKKGFEKIKRCCEIAAEDGFDYAWVDTCCIDKTSSAELSEAINSMYQWYRRAEVCYAFLSDVPVNEDPQQEESAFRKSRWFTRGWTLQELIAPVRVTFFDSDWNIFGTKQSLQDVISEITKIQIDALVGNRPLGDFSAAQKMSWASNRNTTRIEDVAYCLMGIFDINMPMLYGEGSKAFIRLQEHIITNWEDDSIFTWLNNSSWPLPSGYGLLAPSPAAFSGSGNIIRVSMPKFPSKFSWSGSHIRWKAHVLRSVPPFKNTGDLVMLRCRDLGNDDPENCVLAIRLTSETGGSYRKRIAHKIYTISASEMHLLEKTTLFVEKIFRPLFEYSEPEHLRDAFENHAFQFRCVGRQRRQTVSLEAYFPRGYSHQWRKRRKWRIWPTLGIRLKDTNGLVFDLMFWMKCPWSNATLTASIVEPHRDESLKDVFNSFYENIEEKARPVGDQDNQDDQGLTRLSPKTSDWISQRHLSGAQMTVRIKKIGQYRERSSLTDPDAFTIEKLFTVRRDSITKMLPGNAQVDPITFSYLIDVKLD